MEIFVGSAEGETSVDGESGQPVDLLSVCV